ncbi:MAG TPA: MDR family MFS transporter [Dehalococcoidia bacterium]|nr:MDR family MFS transporter [Dehalococcoidia bacterium]
MMAEQPAAPTQLSHRQVLIVFSGLMLGMLLAALDQTIVATALPTITGDLGGLNHLSWVVTAYLLTSTASVPLYGKISDLYGRKRVFQVAIVLFLIGSVVAGAAQNMLTLILARGVQGIGGGGLMALSMVIIADIVAPRERGRYQGYTGAVFATSSVAGPLLGGFFTDSLSWRWIFYINLPLGLLALIVTSAVLNLPFVRRDHKVDYLGAGLLVSGVSALLLVAVWGGNEYAWTSSTIRTLAVVGTVLMVAFLLQERRAEEPILPLRLFNESVFSVGSSISALVGLAMFGATVFLPLYFQVVTGASATKSGLLMIPMVGGLMLTSISSGRIISHTGKYRMFPIAGAAVTTVGLLLLAQIDVDTPRFQTGLFMFVLGAGLGMMMQTLILAVQNVVPHADMGAATSGVTFFRSMGGAFGVAIFGSIMNNRLDYYVPRNVPPDVLASLGSPSGNELGRSREAIEALPEVARSGVIQAFADSLHVVFLVAVPLAAMTFVLAWFLREVRLREYVYVSPVAEGEVDLPPPPEALAAGAEGGQITRQRDVPVAGTANTD